MADTAEPLFGDEAADGQRGPDPGAPGDPDELGLVIFLTEQEGTRSAVDRAAEKPADRAP